MEQFLSEQPITNLVFSTCFRYTMIYKGVKNPNYSPPLKKKYKRGISASVPKASVKMFASYCVLRVFPHLLTWCLSLLLLYSSHASPCTFVLPWQPTALILVIKLMTWGWFFCWKMETAISTFFFPSSWLSFWAQQCFLLDRNPCAQSPAGNYQQQHQYVFSLKSTFTPTLNEVFSLICIFKNP